jgi:hypothetical protein
MQRWVDAWKRAGPELEKMREEDVRNASAQRAVKAFSGLLDHALKKSPPEPTSGLVEQQRWFMRMARDQRRG